MHRTKRNRLVLIPLVFIFLCAQANIVPAFQAYPHTGLTDNVDQLFKQWDRNDSPGAALGIIKDGRIIYARGYGMANLEYNIPITPQSVFRIASISKQFTAMCIAILAEQGKLSIDDDIRKYFPGMPGYETPVTIRHLLHHISGIRDYETLQRLAGREDDDYFYIQEDVANLLVRQKGLLFKPGDKYLYSNTGFVLLAVIISRVSGMTFSEFAKKHIFDPLLMKNTHIHDDVKSLVKNRATGYSPAKGGEFKINIYHREILGDDGVFTTVEDFLKWDQNFFNNKLGKGTRDLIDTALTCGKLNNGHKLDYAFGIVVEPYRGLRTSSHSGGWVGFRAHYLQFPDQKFSVVILSNLSTMNPHKIAYQIADLYLPDQLAEPTPPEKKPQAKGPQQKKEKPTALSINQLQEYAGDYYSDEIDVTYRLRLQDSHLALKVGYLKIKLISYPQDTFRWTIRRSNVKVVFSRGQERKIDGFIMDVGQMQNIKFEKIK